MRVSFSRGEIVWGKIEAYPWWPGRVISMHMQSGELIYKVLFFAETTYAYLQVKQLRSFQIADVHSLSQQHDRQLVKAIRMAHQSYAKLQASTQQSLISSQQQSSGVQSQKQSNIFGHQQARIVQNHVGDIMGQGDDQGNQLVDQNREKFDRIRSQETMANLHPEKETIEEVTEKQAQEIVTVQNIIEVLQRRMRIERRFVYNYADRKNSVRQKMALKETLLERYNLHTLMPIPPSQRCMDLQSEGASFNLKRKGIKRSKICKESSQVSIGCLQDQCLKRLYKSARRILCGKISSNSLKKISESSLRKVQQLSESHSHLFKHMFINLLRFIQRLDPSQLEGDTDLMSRLNCFFDRLQADKTEQEDGSKMTQACIPAPDFNTDH